MADLFMGDSVSDGSVPQMRYNGDLCRLHRGELRFWTTLTAGGLAAHRFALTVRARGLGLPVKTGHCLGVLNPTLCVDHPRAGTWTPRQNGILPKRWFTVHE